MDHNTINAYDADLHMAEIYDQYETKLDDVGFIRSLIINLGPLKILEPFCGTGRILIPLALDSYEVVGMDRSVGMLNRARQKIQGLPLEAQERIDLVQMEVLCDEWPRGFDLVILGSNCFYELATPGEQKTCIAQAFRSLNPGGCLFVDNDHMEDELAASWRQIGAVEPSLSGKCTDGTIVESTRETIWFDAPQRLVRFRRCTKVTLPDGNVVEQEYVQQKHPVSKDEVQGWLEKYGFRIEGVYGNYDGARYADTSPRAIFWTGPT
ncbi:MAG TPA: class I SAM-dependent methyltransferase [Anaerolineales bacterium]|nr:class I SAM-dependent methyltransferase [Anaerolineales bacterium]